MVVLSPWHMPFHAPPSAGRKLSSTRCSSISSRVALVPYFEVSVIRSTPLSMSLAPRAPPVPRGGTYCRNENQTCRTTVGYEYLFFRSIVGSDDYVLLCTTMYFYVQLCITMAPRNMCTAHRGVRGVSWWWLLRCQKGPDGVYVCRYTRPFCFTRMAAYVRRHLASVLPHGWGILLCSIPSHDNIFRTRCGVAFQFSRKAKEEKVRAKSLFQSLGKTSFLPHHPSPRP